MTEPVGVEMQPGGAAAAAQPSGASAAAAAAASAVIPNQLVWADVEFSVQVRKGGATATKHILRGVSGSIRSGELLAIMGPSGSGKSTLLDVLANRTRGGTAQGTITVNGAPRGKFFRAIASYVAQEDTLMGSFTVRETLQFAAALTLPFEMSDAEKERRLEKVVDDMGLRSAIDTRVGDIFFKGLSGGQKRRLSIAVELLSEPSIMLLDEPTSGLDAASAFGVMSKIVHLSREGMSVAATIHQPSSELWALFDKLLLLVEGRTAYYGKANAAIDYFATLGYECPQYTNPADFLLGLVNSDFEGHADIENLVQKFATSPQGVNKDQPSPEFSPITKSDVPLFATPQWYQAWVLGKRNLLNNARNPGIYGVRIAMYVMLSLMVGFLFFRVGEEEDDQSITSRSALLFFVAAFLVFMSVAVLPFFIIDRATYLRERGNGNYAVLPYVVANFLTSLPGLFLIALLSSILVVFPVGLNGFGIFLTVLWLSLIVAESLMAVVSAIVPHYIIGIAIGAGFYGFCMLCEGFLLVRDDIPPWFIWGYYIAFHSYTFRVFMYNEFNPIDRFDDVQSPAWQTGKDVLKFYDMENVNVAHDLSILLAFAIGFQIIYYLLLKFRDKSGRS